MSGPPRSRPGPSSLPTNMFPGGVIVQVYGCDDGRLLCESRVLWNVDEQAMLDADHVVPQLHDGESSYLAFYDGDTGERLSVFDGL